MHVVRAAVLCGRDDDGPVRQEFLRVLAPGKLLVGVQGVGFGLEFSSYRSSLPLARRLLARCRAASAFTSCLHGFGSGSCVYGAKGGRLLRNHGPTEKFSVVR